MPSSNFKALTNTNTEGAECPETHFQCLDNGCCLPVFLRCNGVHDCPGKEDEGGCGDYTCPGYYRCRGSTVCLHPFYVCDGNFQCPQKDDEQLCGMSCPEHCVCQGLAFTCTQPFAADLYHGVRYLDAAGSGITPAHLTTNRMLIYLDLSHCNLNSVGILKFQNLIRLDLSHNALSEINTGQLYQSLNLRRLSLSSNPISSLFGPLLQHTLPLDSLEHLDISRVKNNVLDTDIFELLKNVQTVNMSFSGIQHFSGSHFHVLKFLHTLDLRGCPVKSFVPNLFKGLSALHTLHVDNYKLCCSQVLPVDFNVNHCHGPQHILSSCYSLLGSSAYRAVVAALTVVGLISHSLSIGVWIFLVKDKHKFRFHVFLMHMTGCDFLMGVHTAIVTIADQVYRGQYVWKDTAWRHSVMCQVSSCVFFLSTEASAFLTCLMVLERCAALSFPHMCVRVTSRTTHACCFTVWAGSFLLSALSLIPWTPEGDLYSQTGACQPLTAMLTDPTNHGYTLAALVVLSSVLLIITSLGQLYVVTVVWREDSILMSLKHGRAVSDEFTRSRHAFTVVLFDISCWLWSCLSALLTTAGVSVSSSVQMATSLLAMPLKSALNPTMYLVGHMQERQRQTQKKRLIQRLGVVGQL